MKAPSGPWLELDEVDSTQSVAASMLARGEPAGVIFARHQTAGRGRFGRPWVSSAGDSLTMSIVFPECAGHPRPYLVGMAVALAAAGVLHCELRWPNDLVHGERKLGGVLTELLPDGSGRTTPVVGVGVNLNQTSFPAEIADRATSVALLRGSSLDARAVAQAIVSRLELLPEPSEWGDLAPVWGLFDVTPGKAYRLPSGEEAVALGIGSEGQLLASVEGESVSIMAAEAIFGPASRS